MGFRERVRCILRVIYSNQSLCRVFNIVILKPGRGCLSRCGLLDSTSKFSSDPAFSTGPSSSWKLPNCSSGSSTAASSATFTRCFFQVAVVYLFINCWWQHDYTRWLFLLNNRLTAFPSVLFPRPRGNTLRTPMFRFASDIVFKVVTAVSNEGPNVSRRWKITPNSSISALVPRYSRTSRSTHRKCSCSVPSSYRNGSILRSYVALIKAVQISFGVRFSCTNSRVPESWIREWSENFDHFRSIFCRFLHSFSFHCFISGVSPGSSFRTAISSVSVSTHSSSYCSSRSTCMRNFQDTKFAPSNSGKWNRSARSSSAIPTIDRSDLNFMKS